MIGRLRASAHAADLSCAGCGRAIGLTEHSLVDAAGKRYHADCLLYGRRRMVRPPLRAQPERDDRVGA